MSSTTRTLTSVLAKKRPAKSFGFIITLLVASLAAALLAVPTTANADNIFVTDSSFAGGVGEYTSSGNTVNSSLIGNLPYANGLALSGGNLFVAIDGTSPSGPGPGTGSIGEFTTSGTPVNSALVTGLDVPGGIAISGNDIFVANYGDGTIGEYTTSGTVVNSALITDVASTEGVAVSGGDLFVLYSGEFGTTVGEYTTSGTLVNASLLSSLNADSIAASGSNLFLGGYGTIGEYTASGGTVNASLISGVDVNAITVVGQDIYVATFVPATGDNGIGEYTTSGATVNATIVGGLEGEFAIAVVPTPEPSTLMLSCFALCALAAFCRLSRSRRSRDALRSCFVA